jgi:hypothetical protein
MTIPFPFLKNSAGKPDGMWTLTALSWLLCAGMVLAELAGLDTASGQSSALTLFGACAGVYWGRRHTRARGAAVGRPGESLAG